MDDKKNYADWGECWGPTQILSDCCIKSQFEFSTKIYGDIEKGSNLLCPSTDIFNRIREPFSS